MKLLTPIARTFPSASSVSSALYTPIIATAEGEQAPFRLLLGTDAIQIVRDELQGRIDEIDAWAHVSVTTGFPREGGEEDGA